MRQEMREEISGVAALTIGGSWSGFYSVQTYGISRIGTVLGFGVCVGVPPPRRTGYYLKGIERGDDLECFGGDQQRVHLAEPGGTSVGCVGGTVGLR